MIIYRSVDSIVNHAGNCQELRYEYDLNMDQSDCRKVDAAGIKIGYHYHYKDRQANAIKCAYSAKRCLQEPVLRE